jgi:hypothetical protein
VCTCGGIAHDIYRRLCHENCVQGGRWLLLTMAYLQNFSQQTCGNKSSIKQTSSKRTNNQ